MLGIWVLGHRALGNEQGLGFGVFRAWGSGMGFGPLADASNQGTVLG